MPGLTIVYIGIRTIPLTASAIIKGAQVAGSMTYRYAIAVVAKHYEIAGIRRIGYEEPTGERDRGRIAQSALDSHTGGAAVKPQFPQAARPEGAIKTRIGALGCHRGEGAFEFIGGGAIDRWPGYAPKELGEGDPEAEEPVREG